MAQPLLASTIEQPTSGCLQIQSCSGCSSSITAFTPLHSNHHGGGGSFHDRWGQAPPVIADHLNYSGEAALPSGLVATCAVGFELHSIQLSCPHFLHSFCAGTHVAGPEQWAGEAWMH